MVVHVRPFLFETHPRLYNLGTSDIRVPFYLDFRNEVEKRFDHVSSVCLEKRVVSRVCA